MTRIVTIEQDEDGNEYISEDVTDQVYAAIEENEQLTDLLKDVALSRDDVSGTALSLASHPGSNHGLDGRAPIKPKASKGAATPPGSTSRVGKATAKVSKGGKAKAASIGKHLLHAAKVVGRSVAKNPGLAGAAGGAGAALAVHGMTRKLSTDDQLQLDEGQEFEEEQFTDEEIESMTPEQAVALLEEAGEADELDDDDWNALQAEYDAASDEEKTEYDEETRRQSLSDFARIMVKDAESRTPVKK